MKLTDSVRDIREPLLYFLSQSFDLSHSISDAEIISFHHKYLEEHWVDLLLTLSPVALGLFMRAFVKQGLDMGELAEHQAYKETEKSLAIQELESKGLGILRISARYLKISCKFHLHEEVRSFFLKDRKLESFSEFQKSFQTLNVLLREVCPHSLPKEVFQLYFSYGFHLPWGILEQLFDKGDIEIWQNKGWIYPVFLVVDGDDLQKVHGYLCTRLSVPFQVTSPTNQFDYMDSMRTQVFNDLARLVFQIQKDGIKMTKKGEMNRKTLDRFRKIIPREGLLCFLLDFLIARRYLENVEGDLYKISELFFSFFRHSLVDTYQEFLNTGPLMKRLFQIFQSKTGVFLTLADVLVQYFKDYPDELFLYMEDRTLRRSILQNVELLYGLGLIDRFFDPDSGAVYCLSELYNYAKNHHILPEGILTVSRSFQIVVDSGGKEVPPQILYLLSIFADIKSSSPVSVFQMTQQSFHRALYLRLKAKDFIDILILYGKSHPDEFIMQTIHQWQKNYKTGYWEEGILLRSSPQILDELEHKPEYASLIKKRLSAEYALVTQELTVRKILGESEMFFLPSTYSREEES